MHIHAQLEAILFAFGDEGLEAEQIQKALNLNFRKQQSWS